MSQPIIRPLGCSESPFASYAEIEGEKQLAQTAVAVAFFNCSYDERLFKDAIKLSVYRIREKYAALKCGIQKNDEGEYNFVKSSTNDLNYKFLNLDSENDAWAFYQSEVITGIPEFETSLYRITLIKIKQSNKYFMIANIHHSLADGFVYDKVLGEILSEACKISDQNMNNIVDQIKELPLSSPIENFFKPDLTKWSFYKLVLRMTWRAIGRGKSIYALKSNRKALWSDRQSIFNRSKFPSTQFELLKQKAKLNKTTINGCIAAAMMLVFKNMLNKYPEKSVLRVAHAVDLRRRLPSDKGLENNIFCAASGVNTYHKIDQLDNFWEHAAKIKSNLSREIDVHRTPWRVLSAMKEVPNLFDYADGPFSGRSETLGISNIGPVKDCQDCQNEFLQIDSVFIAGSIKIVGALISVIVTTINDSLCFSFMACEPMITPAELDQYASDVMRVLQEC